MSEQMQEGKLLQQFQGFGFLVAEQIASGTGDHSFQEAEEGLFVEGQDAVDLHNTKLYATNRYLDKTAKLLEVHNQTYISGPKQVYINILHLPKGEVELYSQKTAVYIVFNKPGVAGAVLQTPLSLSD